MLDEAIKSEPDSWWWIKADGVDLLKGLSESTSGVWSGDVDLNDGNLQKLYSSLQERMKFISSIGLDDRAEVDKVLADLNAVLDFTKTDTEFLLDSK